jgi:ankyrin repeat protein
LVAALIKNGHQKEVDAHDSSWYTPLYLAAHFGHAEIIDTLVKNGADLNHGMEDGQQTPLHTAAFNGNIKIINQLLSHGARPNAIANEIGGVINAAVSSGNPGVVEILLESEMDAPLDTRKNEFLSPLASAALCSDLSVFENLSKVYSERSRPEEFSKALLAAATVGRFEVCESLLSYQHDRECLQEAFDSAARVSKWDMV